MRALPVLLALSALVLAGCASPEDADGADPAAIDAGAAAGSPEPARPASAVVPADAPTLDAPVWAVGDAWSVVSHNEEEGTEERSTLVVTRVEGSSYLVETTSEQTASFDAIFDVSYVGSIRASDLAGEQQGQPVLYYSFPLQDGKTWTTTWDGQEVSLKATKAARGFSIVGTVEGEPYVEYDYAPELKWFSRLHFVREGYGLTVERLETGWAGSLAGAVAKVVYEGAPAAPVASPNSGAFTVDEGQTALMAMHRGGASGAYASNVLFVDPAGGTHSGAFTVEGQGPRPIFETYDLPPTPGEWHVSAPGLHDPASGFWLTVHQVAVSMREFAGA